MGLRPYGLWEGGFYDLISDFGFPWYLWRVWWAGGGDDDCDDRGMFFIINIPHSQFTLGSLQDSIITCVLLIPLSRAYINPFLCRASVSFLHTHSTLLGAFLKWKSKKLMGNNFVVDNKNTA